MSITFETYDKSKLPTPGKTAKPANPDYVNAVKQTSADKPLSVVVYADAVKTVKAELSRVQRELGVTVSTREVAEDADKNTVRVVFWQRPKIRKPGKPALNASMPDGGSVGEPEPATAPQTPADAPKALPKKTAK